jgi:hypothetical protein
MQYQGLSADEGDVSLAGPVLLLLGVLGIGGLLLWLTKKGGGDYYDDYEGSDAVDRVRNVISDIENDERSI